MDPRRFLVLPALLLLALGAAARPASAAWPHDPTANVPVCTAAYGQNNPSSVSDGAGGAILAWQDARSGATWDIYAQHVLASGAVDPAWPANGRVLCNAAGDQYLAVIATDGAGGAIVAWEDLRSGSNYDIYAQHVLASGAVDAAWPANGRALCAAAGDQTNPMIVSDGSGGAIVTWQDYRSGSFHIYAQHVLASGAVDPAWPANGLAICTAANNQYTPMLVPDGAGGAIITWYDYRSGSNADVYVQHALAGGTVDPNWTANGVAVSATTGDQASPVICSDGSGGAIIAWQDARSAGPHIYAHHVLAAGQMDGAWTGNGVAVCTAANSQYQPAIVSDGSSGAIVTWYDFRSGTNYDIYAQHVLAGGSMDGAWASNGLGLCTASGDQMNQVIAPDGMGGAVVAWIDYRSGTPTDVYAQHALITGTVDPAWPANGRAVCTATGTQNALTMVADGSNGCIVGWQDYRSSNSYTHIYAQRVERFGYLGNPEPTIAGVRDVPNDQGGKVKLSWNSSYLEGPPFNQVTSYQIFRSLPPNFAARELARGARLVRGGEPLPVDARRAILATISGGATYYWEYLGSQSAYQFPGYSYYASTAGDSTGVSNQRTYLLVRAITGGSAFWNSAPDSGYSVDNLPPSKPQPFLGNYSGSATALHWGPNSEADLAYYRLYRGETEDFVPGPSNLVAQKPDTGYVDHVAGGHYYKLCAVDVHGNPSVCALLTPQQAGAVPAPGGVATLWLGRATPNPTNAGARIDYGLPRDAWVRLGVYDAAGRLVRQLVSGRVPAGDRSAAWDGRDEQGARVAGGLYFFRLQVGGRTLTARLVAVH